VTGGICLAPMARYIHQAWGSAPGFVGPTNASDESAIHRLYLIDRIPIEARFQRLFAWRFEFLGRCPTFATANPSCGGLA
jgi:hypothetical protein